jgi:hypothetical protein
MKWGTLPIGLPVKTWLSSIATTARKSPDPGIIIIGQIDSGVETFNVPGSVKVTIELVQTGLTGAS